MFPTPPAGGTAGRPARDEVAVADTIPRRETGASPHGVEPRDDRGARPAYRPFDADNHYYETRDAFTRHIDPAYAERTFRVRTDADGVDRMAIDGRPYVFSPATVSYTHLPSHGTVLDLVCRVLLHQTH